MNIELQQVRKSFADTEVLRGISLAIKHGQRVGLVGPNGSGKSTLVRILLGLLRAEGSVRLDGLDPFVDHAKLLPFVGYVPQNAPQLAAPVDEVVATVCGLRGLSTSRVEELCGRLALDLSSIKRRPLRNLSGGMKQKLLIALAFAASASLYILDEPTASLDASSRDLFFKLYAERAQDATLVLCSHRLEEVRQLVDHVLVLSDGNVSFFGPVSEFLSSQSLRIVEVISQEVRT